MNKRNVRRTGVATLFTVGLVLTGCTVTPEPDNMILQYTGGSQEGSKFKGCVDGGTVGDGSVNDNDIYLMTSERTWNIAKSGGDTDQAIEVATKADAKGNPGPKVKVYLKADFFLNTSCEGGKDSPVVKWWETIGRRYGADVNSEESSDQQAKDEGWRRSLENTLVPSERRAIQDSARMYTADELDTGSNGSWANMEAEIEKRLSTDLNANGSFYCGPGFDRKNGKNCPPIRVTITDIDYADESVANARAAVYAAELQAKERLIKAQAEVNESRVLAQAAKDPNYMRLKELEMELAAVQACAQNPNCTIVYGAGANVNVAGKK